MLGRISSPIDEIAAAYRVVVVGSGYGGSIAAARLASAGQEVCLLERGREVRAGGYAKTATEFIEDLQVDAPDLRCGSASALYEFNVNPDINVFKGCGLGGTSLVNANVSLRPNWRVFADSRWPEELRWHESGELPLDLEQGFERAQHMLQPLEYPESSPRLAKTEAHRASAKAMGRRFKLAPLNVHFEAGVNNAGIEQKACNLCGDCVVGCNHDAKNTLLYNYLPIAARHGAKIFCEVDVRSIKVVGDSYLVYYKILGKGREAFENSPLAFVRADVVIVSAGTLGSTEILLRSRQEGLSSSESIGRRFTGNGDALGFAYNTDRHIHGVGFGERSKGLSPIGPCITSVIDDSDNPDLSKATIFEEGSIPGALAKFLPWALALSDTAVGRDMDHGAVDRIKEVGRTLSSVLASSCGGAYRGAVRNTQTYLGMGHDDDAGEMRLEHDRLRIHWPGVGKLELFERINASFAEATKALGGIFIKNPLWTKLTGHDLVTVHPLGGCVMAADASGGVVNHKGQVFSAQSGVAVYEGLYICDGSVVPRPVGVNPLLTISALAERCIAHLARERSWTIPYVDLGTGDPGVQPSKTVGTEFTEVMRGHVSSQPTDDFVAAELRGRDQDSHCQFTLTVVSHDLDRFIDDAEHAASLVGTVTAPCIAAQPLMVTGGDFNLFVAEPGESYLHKMWYRMRLTSEEGQHFYFAGYKVIHDDRGCDVWEDCTTLFVKIHQGESEEGAVLATGILHISVADFIDQLTTMSVVNASGLVAATRARLRFGEFFVGTLFDDFVKDKLQ